MKTDREILDELRAMSAGSFYMSESDYSFELVQWEGGPSIIESLRSHTGEPADAQIEELTVDGFLGSQHQPLAELLKSNLGGVRVYKVGRINRPVYVVGRSPEGSWLGLSTRVVET